MDKHYKILVKFPTRDRPEQFFKVLDGYINNSTGIDIHYLITLDDNDLSMSNRVIQERLNKYPNLTYVVGQSFNKIQAVNRDMRHAPKDWDIVVLASDDMVCVSPGWDEVLRYEMNKHFPDTDGCLFHWDGDNNTAKHNNGNGLCTMNITGRNYFDRFGYLYHPSYSSLWCDNEYTEVAQSMNKMEKFDTVLFEHQHWSNTPTVKIDKLMTRNNNFYKTDERNFLYRKSKNFPK